LGGGSSLAAKPADSQSGLAANSGTKRRDTQPV
jgi:hypothetical protein